MSEDLNELGLRISKLEINYEDCFRCKNESIAELERKFDKMDSDMGHFVLVPSMQITDMKVLELVDRLAKVEQKVDSPEWLDVLVLDLIKPQINELKKEVGNLKRALTSSTHINSCISTSGDLKKEIGKVQNNLKFHSNRLSNEIVDLKGEIKQINRLIEINAIMINALFVGNKKRYEEIQKLEDDVRHLYTKGSPYIPLKEDE